MLGCGQVLFTLVISVYAALIHPPVMLYTTVVGVHLAVYLQWSSGMLIQYRWSSGVAVMYLLAGSCRVVFRVSLAGDPE